ncbi:MAG: LysR family transcriptional regulator [Oscillospiraceae bacterium]
MNNLEIACFLSLYKTRDIAASADVMCITQRAFIQNIKRLETELGFNLFLKDSKGLHPTIAGEKYYNFFLLRGKELLKSSSLLNVEERRNTLYIGWCNWLGCPELVSACIKRFKAGNPDITVAVRQISAKNLKGLLYERDLDIALTSHVTSGSLKGQIVCRQICEVPLYLLVSRNHSYCSHGDDLKHYLSLPHITSYLDDDDESRIITRCIRTYRVLDVPPPEIRVLPNWESVYVEVNLQNGIAFVPDNNVLRNHDCFNMIDTGLRVPFITLTSVEPSSRGVEPFMEMLMREAELRNE